MSNFKLPDSDELAKMFNTLLGKDVAAQNADKFDQKTTSAIGLYTDNNDSLRAICLFDLPMAVYSGSAFAMINADAAQEAINDGNISAGMKDNVYEIFNISVGLFNAKGSSNGIRLKEMEIVSSELPENVATFIAGSSNDCVFELDIENYGSGKMQLYIA